METEKSLVKTQSNELRLPKFVEDAYDSIDKMNQFAEILLQSKLIPYHFYEKGQDNKPDFSKGKSPAVVAVLIQGHQLALPPLTALQHIVPVNGLLSIKGDMAKSLIFNSGKLKPDSWKEEESGSLENQDYVMKITATRADNGMTISRSFSIAQAKRAGLWITDQQVAGQDGWKYKSSAWYKFPLRMIYYRALGFIARDGFSDVLTGIYTTEEAMDMPKETSEVIETESGAKITIPDKDHAQKRSGKMTERVADKIQDNKFGAVSATIPDAVIVEDKAPETPPDENEMPFKAEKGSVEYMNGKVITRDGEVVQDDSPVHENQWTLKQMEEMDTKILLAKVNSDMDMMEANEMIPGKSTNKKLREIINAWQNGTLAEYVAPYLKDNTPPAENNATGGETEASQGAIPPNKEFDKQASDKGIDDFLNAPFKPKNETTIVNKYGIDVSEIEEGKTRDFSEVKKLFNALLKISPVLDNSKYVDLAGKMGYAQKYPDRETFLKCAPAAEINRMLNEN